MQTVLSPCTEVASPADLFTGAHIAQRRALSALLTEAGTLDWFDARVSARFVRRWSELRRSLVQHAEQEDALVGRLLERVVPWMVARIAGAHGEIEQRLALLGELVATAHAAPNAETGLWLYRELSAFISVYFVHLLDEELIVVPAIRRRCRDASIAPASAPAPG